MLDGVPAVADRVGDRTEVLLDGGIRRGSDIDQLGPAWLMPATR